ncbi:MAG: OmpA family protein [Myxococcota bacterium]|nr:OmpA family protein [Myxococcota bacterium]
MSRQSGTLMVAFLLWAPVMAQAQVAASPSTFDLERLELNPSGLGSLVVGAGELLPASSFRSAVIAHYENEPLLLMANGQRQGKLVQERLTLHLMRQYSLAQRVEFALILPIVVFQAGDRLQYPGVPEQIATGGLASPVLSARVALLRSMDGWPLDAALQVSTALPFGNPNAFARNPGLTFAPRLLLSRRLLDWVMVSGEFGGLLRPPVTLGDEGIHNELSANAAVSSLTGALRGELALRSGYYFEKAPSSVEVLAGVRYALTDRIELTTVASAGLLRTPGTPLFRVLFGASFLEGTKFQDLNRPATRPQLVQLPADTTAPVAKVDAKPEDKKPSPCVAGQSHDPKACPDLDLDNDGIKNSADTCPGAAEDKDGFQDADGCPDPDNDADTVPDAQDKCPNEAGPVDREGCPLPDEDKDGVEDSLDDCPKIAGPADRKGCPLSDTDGDGILDSADGCPSDKGPLEARGCPVKDTDGDKVPDHQDNCPTEAGTAKNRGCAPAQKQLVYITREKLVITDTVHFATNSARVLPKSFLLLKQVARVIKDHPEIRKVVVEGHTDNVGNALKNLRLSQQRADSVRRYLVLQGVSSSRLEAKGYGHTRPIMPNLMPRGRAANRRVEFTIPEAD